MKAYKTYKILSTIFIVCFLFQSGFAQTVTQTSGNGCKGEEQSFYFDGSNCTVVWQIIGVAENYVITEQNNQRFKIIWNQTANSETIIANYYNCSNGKSGTVSAPTLRISDPITPSVSINKINNHETCDGSSVTFTAGTTNIVRNPIYTWYVNEIIRQSNSSSTFTAPSLYNGDVVKVSLYTEGCVTNGGVATSSTITMSLTPKPILKFNINGPEQICYGEPATYTAVQQANEVNPSYVWYIGEDRVEWAGHTYLFHVPKWNFPDNSVVNCKMTTQRGCLESQTAFAEDPITVKHIQALSPTVTIGTSNGNGLHQFCEGEQIIFTTNPANAGNSPSFRWYRNGGTTVVATGASYAPNMFSDNEYVSVEVVPDLTCYSNSGATASTQNWSISRLAKQNAVVEDQLIPYNTSTTVSAGGAGSNESYRWYDAPVNGNLIHTGNDFNTPVLTQDISYFVSRYYTNLSYCEGSRIPVKINVNKAPIVNAGPDIEMVLPENQAVLTGSALDEDGNLATIIWTQESGPDISFSWGNTLVLNIPKLKAGTYVFRLTATDNENYKSWDEVTVTVSLPENNYNYIITNTILEEGVIDPESVEITTLGADKLSQSFTYFDGLGRPMQTVQTQGSPATKTSPGKKDIVQPIVYDIYGREPKKYLPYVSSENTGFYKVNTVGVENSEVEEEKYYNSPQYEFYTRGGDLAYDFTPFAETRFEESPLNRIIEQGAPGRSWQLDAYEATIKMSYLTNVSNEVQLWEYKLNEDGSFGVIKYKGYYHANKLYKTETRDEHQKLVLEYKDMDGKVVLKQVQSEVKDNGEILFVKTYYIYDDFNNLRLVIPPMGVASLPNDPSAEYELTENFIKTWCFAYNYDERNRMIEKQVPGADKVIMKYDKRDRLVLTQDGKQRAKMNGNIAAPEWTYTKFDALNRPIIIGIISDVNLSELNSLGVFSEDMNTSNSDYTLDKSFPTNAPAAGILSATYYDNYDFLGQTYFDAENLDYKYSTNSVLTEDNFNGVKGQVTGSKVKVLGTNRFLNSVSYYDYKGRVIQSVGENYIGGLDRVSNQYDFVGKLKKSLQEHTGKQDITITQEFVYDHAGRVLEQWQQIGNDRVKNVLLAKNSYNELGQLVDKGIGVKVTDNGNGNKLYTPLQSIDYRYNIRGWLTNINKSDLSNDNGQKNDDDDDKFGMEMLYEQPLNPK